MRIEQQQRQVLTFALTQALHMLQLPQLELTQVILAEIERNPLLELDRLPSPPPLMHDVAAPPSLREYLRAQAREAIGAEQMETAYRLIDLMDDQGLLPADLSEAERALLLALQRFDPPGLFATSLRESLLLQLKAQGRERSPAARLVECHFDDLLQGRWTQIQRAAKMHPKTVQAAIQRLAELRLRLPSHAAQPSSLPDFILEEQQIALDESQLPTFHLRTEYDGLKPSDREERETLQRFRTSARWLIRCLSRRRTLLQELAKRLFDKQKVYLMGDGPLAPLTLQDLANEMGVHLSTVSRALSDKTLLTPRGQIQLKELVASPKKKFTGSRSITKL